MSSRFRPREEPGLFDDLPLQQDPERRRAPVVTEEPRAKPTPESLPLFSDDAEPSPIDEVSHSESLPHVPFKARLAAGVIDLGVILGVMLAVWIGLWSLGVDLDLMGRVLVLVFLLPFSFLYQIFPLAFWGRTPGMARVGIVARSHDGEALSFSQAALRWLASVLTIAFLGLPLILTATTGQSLADRLSGSQILPAR